MNKRRGFSLPELLVALGVGAVLIGLILPAVSTAKTAANRTRCASNLRQIGVALHLYAGDHGGQLPPTTHTTGSQHITESWIHGLAGYLDDVDRVRVCPADPPARQKRVLERRATSYALNDLVFDSDTFNRLPLIPRPSRTLFAVILSESRTPSPSWDHVHASLWTTWQGLLNDVEADRHRPGARDSSRRRGSANYLYADGHVEKIAAAEMKVRIDAGMNPALPPE